MQSNFSEIINNVAAQNPLNLSNQFYGNPQYILYFIPQAHNFTAMESFEVPKLIRPIQIENGRCMYQQENKPKKTHKISKPPKSDSLKPSLEKAKSLKSQLCIKTVSTLPERQTKQPVQEKFCDVTLDFRIQWKNQYRNIVPNLINQTLSFLTKKCKSQSYISLLFNRHSHPSNWHLAKFYQYMKRIKDQISHYVDEKVIGYFFRTHEPCANIYEEGEQEYYMKIARIAVLHYMRSQAVAVSLTSPRMKDSKRAIHLIARRAILSKFIQMALNTNQ